MYEEFLKFLDLFSRDILDVATLVERAKVFFGEGDLMAEFKDLMGWDDRDKLEKGPPGSIRTGPSDLPGVPAPDDGEGPSYRRVPPSVRSWFMMNWLETYLFPILTGGQSGVLRCRSALSFRVERRLGVTPYLGIRRVRFPIAQEDTV